MGRMSERAYELRDVLKVDELEQEDIDFGNLALSAQDPESRSADAFNGWDELTDGREVPTEKRAAPLCSLRRNVSGGSPQQSSAFLFEEMRLGGRPRS